MFGTGRSSSAMGLICPSNFGGVLSEMSEAKGKKIGSLYEGLLFTGIGSVLFLYSLNFHDGGEIALSSALFPVIVTLMITLLGLLLIVQHFRGVNGMQKKEAASADSLNMRNMWFVFFLSLGYAFALPYLHFVIATILYLAVFLYLTGERRMWMLGLLSFGTVAAIYIIFQKGLGVLLP